MKMKHPFADLIGLAMEKQDEGVSVCTLAVQDKLLNPHNVVHGAVLYSMADTGMGGALYPYLETGELCATIEIKITYFKPVDHGMLECNSKLINKGRTIASLESEIFNNGRLVAKANGSFSIFKPGSMKQR